MRAKSAIFFAKWESEILRRPLVSNVPWVDSQADRIYQES